MFRRPFQDPMQRRTENKPKICLGEPVLFVLPTFSSLPSASQSFDGQPLFSGEILNHFNLPIKSMASWKWELMSAMWLSSTGIHL